MPYSANSELPNSVRSNLPEHGQTIYREAWNSGYEQTHSEVRASKIAWSAVGKSYDKKHGRWVPK